MIENRKTVRIKVCMAIAFSSNGDFLCGDVMDIRCNGVFIMTKTVLPVDTELALRIRLPDDLKIMDIVGGVAWVKQASDTSLAGLGIEFVTISAEDRIRIKRFVDKRSHELNPSVGLRGFAEAA